MFLLITLALTLALLTLNNPTRLNPSVATSLFERANTINGQNPREANELRASALAFLSVVR